MSPPSRAPHRPSGAPGVAIAVVTSRDDPDSRGRVRLRYPWLPEEHETGWVRIATPHAGDGRGVVFLPEVDDEVVVAFEHADLDRPIVIGSLWGGRSALPCETADGTARQCIRTRSGFRLEWEDGEQTEVFAIRDPEGRQSVVLDARKGELRISVDGGDLRLSAPDGVLRLECRDLEVDCSGRARARAAAAFEVRSDATLSIETRGDLDASAGGRAAVTGRSLDVRGATVARLRGARVQVQGDALLEQKAPLVKIN